MVTRGQYLGLLGIKHGRDVVRQTAITAGAQQRCALMGAHPKAVSLSSIQQCRKEIRHLLHRHQKLRRLALPSVAEA